MKKVLKSTTLIFTAIIALIMIIFDRIILALAIWKNSPSLQEYNENKYLIQEMLIRQITILIIVALIFGIWSNIYFFNLIF